MFEILGTFHAKYTRKTEKKPGSEYLARKVSRIGGRRIFQLSSKYFISKELMEFLG